MKKPLRVSDTIRKKFQKKYDFADLGEFESVAAASTQVENLRMALSAATIGPSGDFKTSIMKDVQRILPARIFIYIEGVSTAYDLGKPDRYPDLNYKCLFDNDIEDLIKAFPRYRVAGILSFRKNLIDGHAQLKTNNNIIDRSAKCFGVVVNIPDYLMVEQRGRYRNLLLGTFADRLIPFKFSIDWKNWKRHWERNELKDIEMDPIELEPSAVTWDFESFRKRISNEAQTLATLKYSELPRNIELVTAFLCGSALLNGRDRVVKDDFKALDRLKPYFGWGRMGKSNHRL